LGRFGRLEIAPIVLKNPSARVIQQAAIEAPTAMSDQSADALFATHFLPLYPDQTPAALANLREQDANPANNPSLLLPLREAAETFARLAPAMLAAPQLALDFSDASIARLSAAVRAANLLERLGRTTIAESPRASELANFTIHASAYVGECVVRNHAGRWQLRNPLWESRVFLASAAGEAQLPIFHWWLRTLVETEAEFAVAGGLASRYRSYVQVPCFDAQQLVKIASADRKLPKLSKVRYDLLYKHLKAHLPELRDLGQDFPTPERFAAYEFKWLDFLWLGDGKMVLFYGQGKGGLHLFWMSAQGFEQSALIPCDGFPAPIVRCDAQKIVIVFSVDQQLLTQEMLWWGM
jgi:hypothetical protein